MISELEPIDVSQCQAEIVEPQQAFRIGHVGSRTRCTNKPTFISTENIPGPDGCRGAMSVCPNFLKELLKQFGDKVTIYPITGN